MRPSIALFATFAAIAGWCAEAEAAIVRLKSSATAVSAVVRLSDVADVVDADPDQVERLADIALAPAPAPGGEMLLEFDTIRGRLQAHGVNLSRIEFTGSSEIRVKTPAAVVEPTIVQVAARQPVVRAEMEISDWQYRRAESLVAEAVRQHLGATEPRLGRVSVEVRLDRDDVLRVLSLASQGFVAAGGGEPWDAWQTMTVRPRKSRGETGGELHVSCRISPKPFVVAAKHALPRGHIIKPGDLVLRQVDQAEAIATRPEEVVGRETKRTFRPDEPIDPEAIQNVPLIRSNDIVTVYARQPGVTVKRLMKARSEGSAGDQVTLVTLDGRQQLVARVTGYHEAQAIGSNETNESRVRFAPAVQETTPEVRPAGFTRQEGGPP
ncbi:MAG: flagellar basal body P-ring formation chaperone FlgA [Planctomycetaceae bacterium]